MLLELMKMMYYLLPAISELSEQADYENKREKGEVG